MNELFMLLVGERVGVRVHRFSPLRPAPRYAPELWTERRLS